MSKKNITHNELLNGVNLVEAKYAQTLKRTKNTDRKLRAAKMCLQTHLLAAPTFLEKHFSQKGKEFGRITSCLQDEIAHLQILLEKSESDLRSRGNELLCERQNQQTTAFEAYVSLLNAATSDSLTLDEIAYTAKSFGGQYLRCCSQYEFSYEFPDKSRLRVSNDLISVQATAISNDEHQCIESKMKYW
ncbi:hypothetical protein [Vibrio maerlii]|uniref:hypothetical protein n=1 Tax=Vibrio maerlii TaxID=2231648 RepID=UPI000E3C27A8|nr:hypothetical protein [Vibrio maerlii]